MKEIIFATGNAGKMREIREIMADLKVPVALVKEAGIDVDIVEDGTTFEENAMIKARAVAKESEGAVVMADDSGLEVDYLNKEPGIYSARYLGEDTSYEIKNQTIIDRLAGVPKEKRTARFVCAIAAVLPDGREFVTRETIEGYIGRKRQEKMDLAMIRFSMWTNMDVPQRNFLRSRRMKSVTVAKHCVP